MTEASDLVVPETLSGERVDRAVALLTGLTRQQVANLIAEGGVRIDGQVVTTRSRRVSTGDALHVDSVDVADATPQADPDVPVTVVHEDANVIVVDKQPGLVVHPGAGSPTGTLVNGLLARYPEIATVGDAGRPGIVHRLDRGTSGLLVVARTASAYESLVEQMSGRTADRRYTALVLGTVEHDQGMVDAAIGRHPREPTRMAVTADGREARTRYEVRARFATPLPATLVDCKLETGRTHQIRVHLSAIGHPVIGDARYGGRRAVLAIDRPFLHAHHLAFDSPSTGKRVSFDAPLPTDLHDVLAAFAA